MTLEESVEVTRLYSVCGLLGEHASVLKKASVSCSPPYNDGSGTYRRRQNSNAGRDYIGFKRNFVFR